MLPYIAIICTAVALFAFGVVCILAINRRMLKEDAERKP